MSAQAVCCPWRPGMLVCVCGPTGQWTPDSQGPWQPRIWSSHPGDAASTRIRPQRLFVDFGQAFRIDEVVVGHIFRTARIQRVDLETPFPLVVWMNLAKLEWTFDGNCLCWRRWVRRAELADG